MTRKLLLKQRLVKTIPLFYLLLSVWPVVAEEKLVEQYLTANQNKTGMPHWSQIVPQGDQNAAYAFQKQWVSLRLNQDPIAGYKAGLTSQAGQKKFAVNQALSGVLFASGLVADPKTVKLASAGKLMVETEIGFILAQDINSPLSDVSQLKESVESILPVIELPDLAYQQPSLITGIDLIAANLASHQYILGEPLSADWLDQLNQIKVELTINGESVNSGIGADALGDQQLALLWLINHQLSRGYSLKQGDLLITGALGKMLPAKAGHYQADFGRFGLIKFDIQ